MNIDSIGGRKFVAFLIVITSGILVQVLTAKGITTELVTLLLGASGVFSAANVANTMTTTATGGGDSAPPATTVPVDEIAAQLAALNQLQVQAQETQAQILQTVTALGQLAARSMAQQ